MTEAGAQEPTTLEVETPAAPPPAAGPGTLYWLQSLAGTIVIAVFVITFVVQAFQIPSESMEKTLLVGDYLLVDKIHFAQSSLAPRFLPVGNIQRGDISCSAIRWTHRN